MAKANKYIYTVEDIRAAYIRGIEAGKEEIRTEIVRALNIEEYIRQQIEEHENNCHFT